MSTIDLGIKVPEYEDLSSDEQWQADELCKYIVNSEPLYEQYMNRIEIISKSIINGKYDQYYAVSSMETLVKNAVTRYHQEFEKHFEPSKFPIPKNRVISKEVVYFSAIKLLKMGADDKNEEVKQEILALEKNLKKTSDNLRRAI